MSEGRTTLGLPNSTWWIWQEVRGSQGLMPQGSGSERHHDQHSPVCPVQCYLGPGGWQVQTHSLPTSLLQDSLGGNTWTLMVACVSLADDSYEESLSTLCYTNQDRNIRKQGLHQLGSQGCPAEAVPEGD